MKEIEIILNGAEWHSDGRVTYSYTVEAGDVPEQSMSTPSMFVDGCNWCKKLPRTDERDILS